MKRIFLFTLVVATYAGSLSSATQVGDIAQEFVVEDFIIQVDQGTFNFVPKGDIKLSDFHGSVLILDFFAWWCGPCKVSSPLLVNEIEKYFADNGGNTNGVPVFVLGVNIEPSLPQFTKEFIENAGMENVVNDSTDSALSAYNQFAATPGIPLFVIINGVSGSPTYQQWEVLDVIQGFPDSEFEKAVWIARMKQLVDQVDVSSFAPSIFDVNENIQEGSPIGTISISNGNDTSNPTSVSLVNGEGDNDNALFSIVGDQLLLSVSPNYELKPGYSIRIKAIMEDDSVLEDYILIRVVDINEAPTGIDLGISSVSESVAVHNSIATIALIDPDLGQSNGSDFQLVDGDGADSNGFFSITNNQLNLISPLDYETEDTLSIRIRGVDIGGLAVEDVIILSILDANEPPTSIEIDNSIVSENVDVGHVIGTLSLVDPDYLDNNSIFSFENGVGGEDNSLFLINGSDLILNEIPDYESKSSYSVRIRGYDTEGQSVVNELTVNVTDVNEFPVLGEIGNRETKVSTPTSVNLSSTDEDGDSLFYAAEIRSGNVETEISNSMLYIIPESNWSGLASISVTVFDGKGGLDTETFELFVYKDYFIDANKLELESTLSSNPSDPVANYHYIFWEFAELLESTKFKSMLNTLGFSSNIFDLTVDSVQDDGALDNIEFSLNTEFQLEEIRSYMLDDVIPKLDSLEARFATIGQDEVIQLYQGADFGNDIFVDYADSLVLRAITKFLTSMMWIELAYGHYGVSTKEVSEMYYSGILTTEYLRDKYPDYGSVYDASFLQIASSDLKDAIDFYQEASQVIRSPSRTQGLFLLEQDDFPAEEDFSDNLAKLELTLDGQHAWGDNVADLVFINLKPFFDGQVDLSLLLPQSYGNLYRDSSFTDPTFGGIFPTMTDEKARQHFREAGLFSDNLWLGTVPLNERYWWETDGHWWRSHWFGMMYRESPYWWYDYEQRNFPSQWMFHLWLGWIYPAIATPESIWIWQQDSESWMWTNKELFPVLYSHTSGLWFYVSQEDGSQYIWLNDEWVFFK